MISLGEEITIKKISWIKEDIEKKAFVEIVIDNPGGLELAMKLSKPQLKALGDMIQKFFETGQIVKADDFPINEEAISRLTTSIRGEKVSIFTTVEAPEEEFGQEYAGFYLVFKDPEGNRSDLILDVYQAKRIRYLLDKLIQKYDLVLEAKKELVPAEVCV